MSEKESGALTPEQHRAIYHRYVAEMTHANELDFMPSAPPCCEDCGWDLEHAYDMKCRRCLRDAARGLEATVDGILRDLGERAK